ncbi:Aste57867_12918 [Aphanomyces stellatus]|uniref:Aste57867_12918 protein n=1 Tax=Aphanomyces stellatus TaxID=120398 RepID=A0A485KYV6_9STRA|nr:hypothetical protein As57867_012870 [Aphanomyces stellatus]VFT89764.1 Aste57867_12918 [Aphanomyces stellatus]
MAQTRSSPENRRLDRLRKRKYRDERRAKIKCLEQELLRLQTELAQVQAHPTTRKARISPFALAAQVLQKHNQALQTHVQDQRHLVKLMAAWVASQVPTAGIPSAASWLHSTLVADPVTRRHGFEWLSERAYHMGLQQQASAGHPIFGGVHDGVRFNMHTSNSDDGLTIAGMETNLQFTFFAPFQRCAHMLWGMLKDNWLVGTPVISSHQDAERVDDRLVYFSGANERLGTSMRRILGMFKDSHRVVITYVMIADDERFPLKDGEIRSHGYGWTIFEHVDDDITLMRHSHVQFTPKTTNGVANLEEIGRMFGRSGVGSQYPEAYIEHIRSSAEATYVQSFETLYRNFHHYADHS